MKIHPVEALVFKTTYNRLDESSNILDKNSSPHPSVKYMVIPINQSLQGLRGAAPL